MVPPLLRTILVLAAGLGLALAGMAATNRYEPPPAWDREHPRSTRGCPGLERQVAAWQRELSLRHWTISVECRLPFDKVLKNLGVTYLHRERREAKIWVKPSMSLTWQQYVIVHELVHVGVAADRWWVPAGREEEDFVEELSLKLYLENRARVQAAMLEDFRAMHRPRAARASLEGNPVD